jgi:hypothetical protein
MKKLSLILIFLAFKSQAQTRFFVGLGGAYQHCLLQNKEDNDAPADKLTQRGTWQPSYGIQFGLQFGKHVEVKLAPNYQTFKTTHTGNGDSMGVGPFNAYLQLQYYNLPLQLNYIGHLSEKFSLFGGIGVNVGFLKKYTDQVNANLRLPSGELIPRREEYSGNTGYGESTYFTPKVATYAKMNKPFYTNRHISGSLQCGMRYQFGEHISLSAMLQFMKGITDIENKTSIIIALDNGNGFPPELYTFDFWGENKYRRFYDRPISELNKRLETTTQTIGIGLSIQYTFGKSNNSTNYY